MECFAAFKPQRYIFQDGLAVHIPQPFRNALVAKAIYGFEKRVLCIPDRCPPDRDGASVPDASGFAGKFYGPGCYPYDPLLDRTLFRLRPDRQPVREISEIEGYLFGPERKSGFSFLSFAHVLFPARGCRKPLSWRCENSFRLLPGRRNPGNNAGRCVVYDFWSKHKRSRISCLLDLWNAYGAYGCCFVWNVCI